MEAVYPRSAWDQPLGREGRRQDGQKEKSFDAAHRQLS